eukprot:CCRYP_015012-RA/>CCRYP_015012-RA protein AED:0.00 eAED:0.00 QI:190/1/1/1/0/0/2/201/101
MRGSIPALLCQNEWASFRSSWSYGSIPCSRSRLYCELAPRPSLCQRHPIFQASGKSSNDQQIQPFRELISWELGLGEKSSAFSGKLELRAMKSYETVSKIL